MAQTVEVSMEQRGDIYTIHTGSPVLGNIVMDYTGYAETNRGGNSAILLVSAAVSCFSGSVRAALLARGVPFGAIRATGIGEKEPNEAGAIRLKRLSIDLTVEADETYDAVVRHCAQIVKNCTITASIFEGIAVSHTIRRI